MIPYLLLILANLITWYPVLQFWFFRGWEQSWLIGMCGYNFSIVCLMQGHAFLYLLNYKLFGWNPTGWYLTGIILHITAVLLIYIFIIKLTNKKIFAFIAALLFSINVAHNDVITWGSFESLYALEMIGYITSILAYLQFKKEEKSSRYIWYGLSIMILVFGLFVRESGLLLPIFLLLTELLVTRFKINRKYIINLIKVFSPYILLCIGYLVFRQSYGGAPNDQIDAMVLLRGALISQGRYLEYIWRGILAFGKFAAVHIIPYPFMNFVREKLYNHFHHEKVLLYFFPVIGIVYTLFEMVIIYLFRKKKDIRNLLIFSFLWYAIPTFFFSFAFSITDYMLEEAYQWDSCRWRYFAFFGTIIFWLTVGFYLYDYARKKNKHRYLFIRNSSIGIIAIYLLINFFLLRSIENEMYLLTFKPPRDFYTTFLKEFKTLPKDYVFYLYPYASPLNDFISEWYYLRQAYYPYLTQERSKDFSEGEVGMLLDRIVHHDANYKSTYFFDYNFTDGLMNKTNEVKKILANQKEYMYPIQKTVSTSQINPNTTNNNHQISISLTPSIHVETPYIYEIHVSGNEDNSSTQNLNEKQKQLLQFSKDHIDFVKNSTISVCKTAPVGARGSAAAHLLPRNIIDGNFGPRSVWVADCSPAWIQIDLGTEKSVGGLAFSVGKATTNVPSRYAIFSSNDAQTWKQVSKMQGNMQSERIHFFTSPVNARYVKLLVNQTSEGQMTTLDEVEVINAEDVTYVKSYGDNYTSLIDDVNSNAPGVLRFSWETNPNNWQPYETVKNNSFYTFFPLDGTEQTIRIEPNENEFYSTSQQFLKRNITKINLDFTGKDATIYIDYLKAIPKYTIK